MTIEVATYINDLQPVNPTSTDQVSQGDDHLRLIKQVLQNSFTGSTRAFNIPTARTIGASVTLLKSDGAGMVYVNTAASAISLTMPTLTAADAGWMVTLCKVTGDVNPIFVLPSSGTISSAGVAVARARRCIPYKRFGVVWDGSNWFCERINSEPIGVTLDFFGSALPAGFEWPNGQILASVATNYPELNGVYGSGNLPDLRGFVCVGLDNMGGAAAGRLPNGFINGSLLGATGGVDGVVLNTNQMPNHSHGASSVSSDSGHTHSYSVTGVSNQPVTGGGNLANNGAGPATTGVGTASITTTTTISASGGGLVHSNLQPSAMCGKIMVVE